MHNNRLLPILAPNPIADIIKEDSSSSASSSSCSNTPPGSPFSSLSPFSHQLCTPSTVLQSTSSSSATSLFLLPGKEPLSSKEKKAVSQKHCVSIYIHPITDVVHLFQSALHNTCTHCLQEYYMS